MQEFVTNNNGIRFLKCCASCENRVIEVTGSRCGLVRAKPKPGKQCAAYRFRAALMDAGEEKGRIKKADYLRFLTECVKANNGELLPGGLLQTRREYEKMYGSIYLTP